MKDLSISEHLTPFQFWETLDGGRCSSCDAYLHFEHDCLNAAEGKEIFDAYCNKCDCRYILETPNDKWEWTYRVVENVYKTPTEPTQLSADDSKIFVESTLNPKEPTEALRKLMQTPNEEIVKRLFLKQDLHRILANMLFNVSAVGLPSNEKMLCEIIDMWVEAILRRLDEGK